MEKQIVLSPEELKVLSGKLEKFNKGLSDKEKGIMDLIIARAGSGTDKELTVADFDSKVSKDSLAKLAGAVSGKKVIPSKMKEWIYASWQWTYTF